MSLFQNLRQRRSCEFDVTIYQADDTAVTLDSGDKVRVKIGRNLATPTLDIVSGTPTANGSSCTAANPTRIVLHEDDLDIAPGVYDWEIAVYDASQDQIKHAEQGILSVLPTQRGGTT